MENGKVPNFLVVGAAKSGTTSLYHYLAKHNDVFVPTHKEPFYLTGKTFENVNNESGNYHEKLVSKRANYEELFVKASGYKAIGDFSTGYLYYYESSIPFIKEYLGNPKIIIILRNPADRAYSNYMHHVRDGYEKESFEVALDLEDARKQENWWWGYSFRQAGLYYEAVKAYLNAFSDVKVFLFEDLKKNPQGIVNDTCDFLGIDHITVDGKVYNKSGILKKNVLTSFYSSITKPNGPIKRMWKTLPEGIRRKIHGPVQEKIQSKYLEKPKINPDSRIKLQDYFKDNIEKVEGLIGKDLSQWNKIK